MAEEAAAPAATTTEADQLSAAMQQLLMDSVTNLQQQTLAQNEKLQKGMQYGLDQVNRQCNFITAKKFGLPYANPLTDLPKFDVEPERDPGGIA